MSDRSFVNDGSPAWTIEHARFVFKDEALHIGELTSAKEDLEWSMDPAPKQWVMDRLTILAAMFSIGRHAADPKDLAVWLSETATLLADLPHDILAHSIDHAVKSAKHGFLPSVGEIRLIGEPLAKGRRVQFTRVAMLIESFERPVRAFDAAEFVAGVS